MLWIMLIIGILSFICSIFSISQFRKMTKELDTYPHDVEYFDYIAAGYGTFLFFPASLFIIGASIWLLIIT